MSDQNFDFGKRAQKISAVAGIIRSTFTIVLSAVPLLGWFIGLHAAAHYLGTSVARGWFLRWLIALLAGAALAVGLAYLMVEAGMLPRLSMIDPTRNDTLAAAIIGSIIVTLAPCCIITSIIMEARVENGRAQA